MSELLFPRQKRLDTLFYFMIAFALLGPTLGIPLTEGFNLTFFRVAYVLLVGGIILRLVMQKNLETSYMYPVRYYAAFFVFWFVYGLISLSWVMSMGAALKYLFYMAFMLPLTLSFPFFLQTEEKLWKAKRVLFWVFAAIIFFAVFESITLIHLPSSRFFKTTSASVTSVFTNQNDLATCITLGLPFLATALFMLNLQKKHKWFLYITGVLTIYVLIATGSRSNTAFALPLASLALIVGLPFVVERAKLTKKNLAKALIAIVVAVILANALSTVFLSEEARQSAKNKLASTLGFLQDFQNASWHMDEGDTGIEKGETGESAGVRKWLLINGFKFLQQSHYMGIGAGNVEPWMEKYGVKVNKVNLHNWWGEILVNFGVLIFVLYMSLYFWMLWRLWKLASLKHSPALSPILRWAAYSTMAALTGYFFGGMAPSTVIHFTPMWITYGLALAVIAIGETQKKLEAE
ncbi:O-antigen ligase family protein [Laceyella putida]|uniref:O-antigen ligase family protein n=1 Tax=Laceyella putida TaxID=110101 RepID=A0ABW2RGC1_9BACL